MDQVDQGGFTTNPFTPKSDLAIVAKTMSFPAYQPVLPPPTAGISPATVLYKECLKNHAASMGGHALDGCGEFMPSSGEIRDQGSMKCAACGCHRNFHRQETAKRRRDTVLPPPTAGITPPHFSLLPRRFASSPSTSPSPSPSPPRLLNPPPPPPPPPPSAAGSMQQYSPGPHMLMALSTGKGSSPPPPSDHHRHLNHHHHQTRRNQNPRSLNPNNPISNGSGSKRKRFRSKFSSEQKEKMRRFAEGLNWKMQRNDEKLVTDFCADVGVSRGVLKVWMHNNKNTIGKIPKNSNNNSNHSSSNNLEDEEEEHELDQQPQLHDLSHIEDHHHHHHQINHDNNELGLIQNHHHHHLGMNNGSSCSA